LTVLICQIRKREELMVSDKSEDEDEEGASVRRAAGPGPAPRWGMARMAHG